MEKREIFLSFRPEFFRPILYDIKKYEYRKRFCMEATTAYLYLSAPLQEVIGIMELGVPIIIKDILDKYPEKSDVYIRAKRCVDGGELFAIPIESLQLYKSPIPISQIKKLDASFHVPQCYLNIRNHDDIYRYLKSQAMYDVEFVNEHKIIYEDNFGLTCKEMELTSEFERKDAIYTHTEKYNIIRCGYLNEKYSQGGLLR